MNGWSRNPLPRPKSTNGIPVTKSADSPVDPAQKIEDLEWRDRWNAQLIERLSERLIQAERAAIDLSHQLERVQAERDRLLCSLLKISLSGRS